MFKGELTKDTLTIVQHEWDKWVEVTDGDKNETYPMPVGNIGGYKNHAGVFFLHNSTKAVEKYSGDFSFDATQRIPFSWGKSINNSVNPKKTNLIELQGLWSLYSKQTGKVFKSLTDLLGDYKNIITIKKKAPIQPNK